MQIGALENEITNAVEKVEGSVVTVNNRGYGMSRYGMPLPVNGQGSGIVISPSGYIMTNFHVVRGAQSIEVTTSRGESFRGSYIGGDPATDIALIRIKDRDLPYANLGDSEFLKVGQFVLAVGNALGLPGSPSVSVGVISAMGRPMPHSDFIPEGLIQTDAAINPGNSGGPLTTLKGEVVGINSSMIPFAQGIGFAIPINVAKRIMEQILEHGRVIRPWLGISGITVNREFMDGTPVDHGVLVVNVNRGSPAYYAGLTQNDIITSVDEKEIRNMRELLTVLSGLTIGKTTVLGIYRNGVLMRRKMEVAEMPEYYLNRLSQN